MDLLQEGVDRSVIALWLGHESIETTQMYLDADLDATSLHARQALPVLRGRGATAAESDWPLCSCSRKIALTFNQLDWGCGPQRSKFVTDYNHRRKPRGGNLQISPGMGSKAMHATEHIRIHAPVDRHVRPSDPRGTVGQ